MDGYSPKYGNFIGFDPSPYVLYMYLPLGDNRFMTLLVIPYNMGQLYVIPMALPYGLTYWMISKNGIDPLVYVMDLGPPSAMKPPTDHRLGCHHGLMGPAIIRAHTHTRHYYIHT